MNFPQLSLALKIAISTLSLSGSTATALLATRAETPVPAPVSPDPAAVEFLLASAAKEFSSSGAGRPTAIRNARIGFLHDATTGAYILCGSFKSGSGSAAKWTPFATIKTSDYEHWIGGAAQAYRTQKNITWYPGNYAPALMRRLEN